MIAPANSEYSAECLLFREMLHKLHVIFTRKTLGSVPTDMFGQRMSMDIASCWSLSWINFVFSTEVPPVLHVSRQMNKSWKHEVHNS